jgi:fatty-acyl-CoA synthase
VSPEDRSLTLGMLRRLAAGRNAAAEVVAVRESGERDGRRLGEVVADAGALAAGLDRLGVGTGDRVATLAWNVPEHLAAYWAVPGLGAVLLTLNARLPARQLAEIVATATPRVLLVGADLAPLAAEVMAAVDCVERVVVFGGAAGEELPDAVAYDDLVGEAGEFDWPELDEHMPAGLCFTSGTVGRPKGVLYTHRQLVLHALTMAAFDPYGLPGSDRVLAVVPMFHAMGWNLPYITALNGSSLILPGRRLAPEQLVPLIRSERATFSSGVPTVWADVRRHVEADGGDLGSLRAIGCGGNRVPEELMRWYQDRGVTVLQGWGMTETGPGGSRVFDDPALDPDERWRRRSTVGWLRPLYEARLRASDGGLAPCDGEAVGEVEVRGPLVIREYYGDPEDAADRFRDGWLRTGDLGTIDPAGWLELVDREKDVIKSGGEWISSLDIESALLRHPAVAAAAVIGIEDERWIERPCACVVIADGATVEAAELREFLLAELPRWWVPESFARVAALPRTGVGKIDKRALRARHESGELTIEAVAASVGSGEEK